MSILNELKREETWASYLKYKIEKHHLSVKEEKELTEFITQKHYLPITSKICEPDYTFDPPQKRSINKSNTQKKRIIYTYGPAESMVLKVMSYLLHRYDDKMGESCYSFRSSTSAKNAIKKILSIPALSNMYCLKADISNYFNSIPAEKLCIVLKQFLKDDPLLYLFLERLLLADLAYENEHLVKENRGAMAGIPISPFFANIYLLTFDSYYENLNIPYFRYSDDILLFLPSMDELQGQLSIMQEALTDRGLSLNPQKVTVSSPCEIWEFLGVCYDNGNIDLSHVTKNKLKKKIKRKASSLYRWRIKKNIGYDRAAKRLITVFNRKLYDSKDENDFTWSRWFFPVLTTTEGLKELDGYLIQYIRYLYSGRHYKGNYKIDYTQIKELGFRSLVNEYYNFHSKN